MHICMERQGSKLVHGMMIMVRLVKYLPSVHHPAWTWLLPQAVIGSERDLLPCIVGMVSDGSMVWRLFE
jgi:hypothetical protein